MPMIIRLLLTLAALAAIPAAAEPPADSTDSAASTDTIPKEWAGLVELTGYLSLLPEDVSFRPDYTEPDSFRLQVVSDLMVRPLAMVDYSASLRKAYIKGQPEVTAAILAQDLETVSPRERGVPYKPTSAEIKQGYNLFYTNPVMNQLMTRAALYIDVIFPKTAEQALAGLTPDQRKFLTNQFREMIVSHEEEEFFTIEQTDSAENAEEAYTEEFVTFGWKIDKDAIVAASLNCLREILPELRTLQSEIASGLADPAKIAKGAGTLPRDVNLANYLGLQPGWKIGGPGNDYYEGDYKFILDFGGDDVYNLSADPTNPHTTIIIDLGGNDHYRAQTDFVIGSGCLAAGILLDFGGNDRYDAKSFALGSGYFGFGLLYDAGGDDRYDGDTHTMAAGAFGLGLLIDEGGRDLYNAALYSQGFGFTEGIGVLYDTDGSDSYYAGGKYKDILRYEDRYLSLSQGFGYGLRPWMSGGIGAIIDDRGNDNYLTDIFGQGTSYWWSLGIIYDSAGNDNYQSFQYAQGCGTHMTLGILIDDSGNDVYYGKGLMQGVGHDYSCGILIDRGGNDSYTAYDLSQAAGSANGVGILIDNAGEDRYLVKNPDNTHGYGNPRRDFGSIGLFIDLGGPDQYTGKYGRDNHYWRSDSKWGGGMDIEWMPVDTSAGEAKP